MAKKLSCNSVGFKIFVMLKYLVSLYLSMMIELHTLIIDEYYIIKDERTSDPSHHFREGKKGKVGSTLLHHWPFTDR